ncbi:uncharacterized protein G2W53_014161 [Senna tora]|uniref:Uncharacterized protein n=1 Tax=Senna tora TaxID=362788 RepID=A0A834WT05_9FABA|nr:uncharacterized protein G2W53_014161 [Senna tora]
MEYIGSDCQAYTQSYCLLLSRLLVRLVCILVVALEDSDDSSPKHVIQEVSHTNSLRKGESTIFSFHRRYQERERAPALERSRRSREEAVRDHQRRTTSVTTPLTIQNRSTQSTRPSTLVKHHCKPPRTSHCSLARPSS